MLKKIISGGQTGADRAALDWAIQRKLSHGGWCPKGRHAEDGPIPAKYQLAETHDGGYNQRTAFNVRDGDGTVIFGMTPDIESPGSRLTYSLCSTYDKPCLYLSPFTKAPAEDLWDFIKRHRITVLNVAGSRHSKAPGIAAFVKEVLDKALL